MQTDATLIKSDTDGDAGQGELADEAGPAGPTLQELRGTRVAHAALEAFPDSKLHELAAIVDRGPGFLNEPAKLQFPTRIRNWAVACLVKQGRHKRLPLRRQTATMRRDELRRIFRKAKEISREAEKLRVLILQLPPESRVELGNAIEITQLGNSVNNTTLGLPYLNLLDGNLAMITRKLATTARAAERAASEIDREVHPWRPERDLKQPLYRLAQIWRESTGKEPTRIWDYTREMRRGPFPEFIYSAIEPLWSDAKSVDGLIDELCSKAEAGPGTILPMT